MQLPSTNTFNQKHIQDILKRESKFLTDLLNSLPLPVPAVQLSEDDVLLESASADAVTNFQQLNTIKKSRAKSLVELQSRLKHITSRKKLSYKEKLLKKTIKSKIKRKGKQDIRNATLKQERLKKSSDVTQQNDLNDTKTDTPENAEPVNTSSMVFSKFDFSGIGKKKFRKEKFDPQKTLDNLQKQKQNIEKLRQEGDLEKAGAVNEKVAWKNALAKAQGEKVKDDVGLLAKSIKKREQQKKSSKRKWEVRQENVKKMKEERQKKRQDNIDKRKKTKKLTTLKKAAKRGKIIPGF